MDVRARLIALRETLLAESEATAEDRAPVALDQQSVGRLSRMDAMAGQNMAAASERARKAQIVKIDAALRRLDDGDYGYCTNCDEPIAPKRLDADPTASLCITCQCAREG
ncbi:MAG: TraR/DksA C4-type zinc finger protein [Rhizobiales bacterium]|nr:TraR/DksA C4-type zinc finger protein [Hyphomicrobiales bacterium]MBO6698498.1 TraR/DksA C4-type zinc finger protein [Hyphomicrobiales bacterium]MBO6735248.1 TraR/DksA C4-type zinc finger protein [Hyphomicrobiales bacterium]MBO6910944.1 TraR/DksA C4-type zinc finger protein [Hyphomicrobiales bacterium]MBO6955987.1 TraR/DksA C4-type zinc finger protein [Hyphomicrobiales bacterium]